MLERKDQKREDTWDLGKIYENTALWNEDLENLKKSIDSIDSIKGTLNKGSDELFNALSLLKEIYRKTEKLSTYAFLEYSADSSNPEVQMRAAIISNIEAVLSQKLSFFDPELLSLSDEFIEKCLKEERFEQYRVFIEKSRRFKAHVLSEKEENLMSLYSPLSSSYMEIFQDLENIDMRFDSVFGKELTNSSYTVFLHSNDESIRKEAYFNYYKAFDNLKNTIAKTYIGSVKSDSFRAKARGYSSSLQMALFPDKVEESVYRNLIKAVHEGFDTLHRYYKIRAKKMNLKRLNHWDVYVPLEKSVEMKNTYEEAVDKIKEAVKPLGEEYQKTLIKGLTEDRWVDRYENVGKRSGAFSSGSYDTMPYILTNFKEEAIDSVFTLIHEGGHSMHSYYSRKNNPYLSSSYTIFEAEVASTFNEQLLHHSLYKEAKTNEERSYLLSKHIDDIVATLFRQTMFAEFELLVHEGYENGEPITLDEIRKIYLSLLKEYFGPIMDFTEYASLEGLRVPHFYTAFYCYKYATGISAAIALSERVINGGEKEREEYLSFLKSGGSLYPIESLKKAGVDMSTEEPVREAIKVFSGLLDEFERISVK